MNFELSDEQRNLQRMLRDFCQKECPPHVQQHWDEELIFPEDIWQKLADLGIMGLPFPEEFGGSSGNIIDEAIVVEEMGRGCNPIANLWIATVSFGGYSILKSGSEEQKAELLPRIASGELKMALALTEPSGGTDLLGGLKTRAKRLDGGWSITGQKLYITGAFEAGMFVVVAVTDPEPAKRTGGMTMFLVDPKTPGIEIVAQPKVGNRVPHSCFVFFDDVKVPDSAILGELNRGFHQIMQTLNNERILIAAQSLGFGRGALEDGVRYANERIAFNKPIGQFQAVQHKLAESAMQLELARTMTYKAAWLQSNDMPAHLECSIAKWAASEAAVKASENGMQIMGGHGYMMEHAMQRYWRDSRLYTFSPITNDMVKNMVGESLGLPRSY